MTVCLVCAQDWQEDKGACAQCGTARQELEEMRHLAGKIRFLFGTTPMSNPPASVEVKKAAPAKPKPRSKPKAKPVAMPPVEPQAPSIPRDADMILSRDISVARQETPAAKKKYLSRFGLAYGLDVVICLVLNYWILQLILMFSTRSLEDLVTFSLIPVLFVLLFFSFLYFWLFFSLFRKTLGCLLVDRWRPSS